MAADTPQDAGVVAALRRRPLLSAAGALALIAVGAWLLFGFFGVQTLFIDEEVSETNPFAAGPGASGLAIDETTEELAADMNAAMDDEGKSGDEMVAEDDPMPAVEVVASGQFISRAHPTEGTAKVITDGSQTFLRLEGFRTDNGPDLNVYLATGDPEGSPVDFVDLGDLKGNIGDQNYEIPAGVDAAEYTTVYIWCVRFSVAFGAAPIG